MPSSIGSLYDTLMPNLDEAADIQEALRLYHYGAPSGTDPGEYNPANTSTSNLVTNSIAGYLNARIAKSDLTAKGQLISASASSTPEILSVGTNNQILIANSATTSGLQWTSTLTSPTITTPVIDTINISAAGASASLWNSTITTGSIATGGSLTSGGITIAGGTTFAGTIEIANASTSAHTISISNAAGAANKTINIGTASTGGTTAIALGSSSGATSTISLNGTVTASSAVTTGGALNLNYASPTIASNNASVASIFTSTVTGINIGSSTIKTTAYPADGTTSTAAAGEGYMGMPQNSTTTGAYRLVAADGGKHIYSTATRTITIPGSATGGSPQVAFPVGSTIVFANASGTTLTLQMDGTTTDTCILANVGTSMTGGSGSRTLAANGMCTLLKVTSTSWIISGNGLT